MSVTLFLEVLKYFSYKTSWSLVEVRVGLEEDKSSLTLLEISLVPNRGGGELRRWSSLKGGHKLRSYCTRTFALSVMLAINFLVMELPFAY